MVRFSKRARPRESLVRHVVDHGEGCRNFALVLAALPALDVEDRVLSLVVFMLDGQRYALHLSAVERVLAMLEVSPLPKGPAIALGVINLHGAVVPVLDLRRRLGFPSRDYGPTAHLLVTTTEARRVALPVDEVLGVRDVAASIVVSPGGVLPATAHVKGIVPLPDGLLFIHDVETFLSSDEERHLAEALEHRP